MATISHKNIADADRHEPKGASTAALGTVYVSDGSGSGAWEVCPAKTAVCISDMPLSPLTTTIRYAAAPFAGVITKLYAILNQTITANDAVITFAINGVDITNGAITVSSSGTAGTVYSATPTALNTVVAGDKITATITNAAASSIYTVHVSIIIEAA
jgi:fumarate reductase subunit C